MKIKNYKKKIIMNMFPIKNKKRIKKNFIFLIFFYYFKCLVLLLIQPLKLITLTKI